MAFHGFDPAGQWLFPRAAAMVAIAIHARVTFDTIDSVIEAGLAGLGLIRTFCYHVRPLLQAGHLREVLPGFVPHGLPVHILHSGEGMVPLKVRAFVDFCAPRLQAGLQR